MLGRRGPLQAHGSDHLSSVGSSTLTGSCRRLPSVPSTGICRTARRPSTCLPTLAHAADLQSCHSPKHGSTEGVLPLEPQVPVCSFDRLSRFTNQIICLFRHSN